MGLTAFNRSRRLESEAEPTAQYAVEPEPKEPPKEPEAPKEPEPAPEPAEEPQAEGRKKKGK